MANPATAPTAAAKAEEVAAQTRSEAAVGAVSVSPAAQAAVSARQAPSMVAEQARFQWVCGVAVAPSQVIVAASVQAAQAISAVAVQADR
jgi:hypothetical protein